MNCDTFTNRDKDIVTYKDRDTVTNIDTVADRDRDIVLGRVRDTVTNRDGDTHRERDTATDSYSCCIWLFFSFGSFVAYPRSGARAPSLTMLEKGMIFRRIRTPANIALFEDKKNSTNLQKSALWKDLTTEINRVGLLFALLVPLHFRLWIRSRLLHRLHHFTS
jgi:hypothetical protein